LCEILRAVQFGHPRGVRLLDEVKAILLGQGNIFQRKDHFILFVCGGDASETADTLRANFLRWAKSELADFITLLAESAYQQTYSEDAPELINLGTFERLIAEICDGVLIFPESVGSYAEIGFFSNTSVKKRVLVANEEPHYSRDSFMNLGPILTIDRASSLRPAIPIRRESLEQGLIR